MRGPQASEVKVGLGPSLAQKQQQIDSLNDINNKLEKEIQSYKTELYEMNQRCTDYVDQIFDLKQKLVTSLQTQSQLSAQCEDQKVLIDDL